MGLAFHQAGQRCILGLIQESGSVEGRVWWFIGTFNRSSSL